MSPIITKVKTIIIITIINIIILQNLEIVHLNSSILLFPYIFLQLKKKSFFWLRAKCYAMFNPRDSSSAGCLSQNGMLPLQSRKPMPSAVASGQTSRCFSTFQQWHMSTYLFSSLAIPPCVSLPSSNSSKSTGSPQVTRPFVSAPPESKGAGASFRILKLGTLANCAHVWAG